MASLMAVQMEWMKVELLVERMDHYLADWLAGKMVLTLVGTTERSRVDLTADSMVAWKVEKMAEMRDT